MTVSVKTIEHDPYEEPFVEIGDRRQRPSKTDSVQVDVIAQPRGSNKTRGQLTGRVEKYGVVRRSRRSKLYCAATGATLKES